MDIYAIPVIGVIIQFLGYLVEHIPDAGPGIVAVATPLGFGALCGVICERSGVVNIGIEGTMLTAAFTGWISAIAAVAILGPGEPGPFGITPALLVGLACALLSAVLISLLHAWMSISLRVDQIISGTIINIIAFGVTGYLNNVIASQSPTSAGTFEAITLPESITSLPFVGWLFAAMFEHGPITLSLFAAVILVQLFLFRSRWGLRTRAVGEHPKAAETVGIDVIRLRYRNVIIAGLFAGLGGAWLSMEVTGSFQAGMTIGRGFIALAAMIVGRWTPIGAYGAALFFALFSVLGDLMGPNGIATPTGDLGVIVKAIPSQAFSALPYVATIVVLAGLIGRSTPPAADGRPYEREATT
ncbi:MAG TPA: ABC transporter permease [Candidatus Limnocylindrales bacterium]|nr:ABC transporter permease [Candidatus Limnocylindrales bacterium]